MNYKKIQEEEKKTWLIEDPIIRNEKSMREKIRYPILKKQMGLNSLDTSNMVVFDIGAGPLGGVSTVVNCKSVYRIDPLGDEYGKYFPCKDYTIMQAEDIDERLKEADLIIVTNALDHFEDPEHFLHDLNRFSKPSCYFAHLHAINNAISHPHPAHEHNLNPENLWKILKNDWECCWYMDFMQDGLTYGWLKQPAFSGLYRKTTGYSK